MEANNVKGRVCLIIEEEVELKDGEERYRDETLLKYNRFGKIIKSNVDGLKCSYDLNGNIIVKEISKMTFFMEEGFKPVTTYWKYFYDENGCSNKIAEYTMSEDNLNSVTLIYRDELHYKTKFIQYFNKNDLQGKVYIDSLMILYDYDTNKAVLLSETLFSGKRIKKTTYKYNSNNKLIQKHEKDLNVYRDSTAYYDFKYGEVKGYDYTDINDNLIETYEYDDQGNIIHLNLCDSTKNFQRDTYWKYQYDENGNWVRCEEYNNLHKQVSYKTRKIEYYPKDGTGNIDYSWEDEDSPLEIEYEKEEIRKRKEKAYLNDEFILEQFNAKMKEYPNYRVKGKPKIIYRNYCTYRINFDALYSWDANFYYPQKVNRTVEIVLNLDDDTYSFVPIKGNLD